MGDEQNTPNNAVIEILDVLQRHCVHPDDAVVILDVIKSFIKSMPFDEHIVDECLKNAEILGNEDGN